MDWFVTDHLGSTKLLIDQNGQHRFTGDDDPFGINLRSFGDKDSHRFTGQILDEEQGVYYYGARYYLPEIGRFLSGDPNREFDSLYVYVGNSPVMMIDPDGKQTANATKEQMAKYQYIVLHETGGGKITPKHSEFNRLSRVVHFLVLKEGNDAKSHQLAEMGVHRGGTKTDMQRGSPIKDPARRAPAGVMIHIEMDYNTGLNIPLTAKQYEVTAKLVVDLATKKGSALMVEPHRNIDRGIPGAHNDPNNFDIGLFRNLVGAELKARKLPSSLVDIAPDVVWNTPNRGNQVGTWPPPDAITTKKGK